MRNEKMTLTYWKARLASKVFNYLWRDPASGMKALIEKNADARANAGIMGWLDHRRISHCKYCPIVDEIPLRKNKDGALVCTRHADVEMMRKNGSGDSKGVSSVPSSVGASRGSGLL